jgi:hypothetical protein
MRWIIWIVAGLALVVLIVAIVGALLPKAHAASRTVRVPLPPDALTRCCPTSRDTRPGGAMSRSWSGCRTATESPRG